MPVVNAAPGPHDPYNAGSVKLAEATRIRLVLPGLVVPEKDAAASGRETADVKTKKKLSKLARLAQNQSSSSNAQPTIELDLAVFAESETDTAPEVPAAVPLQEGTAPTGKSSSSTGNAKPSRRQGAGTTASSDAEPSGAGSSSSAATSPHGSRRGSGDKVASSPAGYVPIWERSSQTSTGVSKEKVVPGPRTFQPVVLKTFSPVLAPADSLLGNLAALDSPPSGGSRPARIFSARPNKPMLAEPTGSVGSRALPPSGPPSPTRGLSAFTGANRIMGVGAGALAASVGSALSPTVSSALSAQLTERANLGGRADHKH